MKRAFLHGMRKGFTHRIQHSVPRWRLHLIVPNHRMSKGDETFERLSCSSSRKMSLPIHEHANHQIQAVQSIKGMKQGHQFQNRSDVSIQMTADSVELLASPSFLSLSATRFRGPKKRGWRDRTFA